MTTLDSRTRLKYSAVVHQLADSAGLSIDVAAFRVLDEIERSDLPLYLLDAMKRCTLIDADSLVEEPMPFVDLNDPVPMLRGRAAVLAWMRREAKSMYDPSHLDYPLIGELAIDQTDAVHLWAPPVAADPRIVQPQGGAWPHVEGEWTDSEREAAFKMRHVGKMTGDELAAVIKVTRQAVDEQIGPAKLRGDILATLAPWRPSPAFLESCGVIVKPKGLQSVAATLANNPAQARAR